MKLRVLICLFLILIVVSDVTTVAATNYYTLSIDMDAYTTCPDWVWFDGAIQGFTYINYCTFINNLSEGHNSFFLNYNYSINIIQFDIIWQGANPADIINDASFDIFNRDGLLVASGIGLGPHTLNLPGPTPPTPTVPINLSHALNFTLAGAMALPTMSIGVVDDIMLIVGKYINCGLAKFAIRAALLKFAAKGVAITVAITGISYLLAEFADDIYNAIFVTVPEVHPGDTHFHKNDLPQVMGIIHSYFPTKPHITMAIEQAIRLHIDIHGYISIAEVMTIVRHKQKDIVIDVYKDRPEILPDNIIVNEGQVPEIMDMIDQYFSPEIPIRDIIEEEINRQIEQDKYNEIPLEEVIDIIEREQNIYVPEVPVQTPEQHQEYVNDLINRVIHEDPYIPTIETPAIFPGIPATPTTPRTPKRPDEKIHTFPFYSIFVDPLAAVIGITLAHLFTAMMIIGAIISIGATWGTIGAIFAGFIGTITTAYFGLTSWLIPVFLIILLIIYANIRIKGGGSKD